MAKGNRNQGHAGAVARPEGDWAGSLVEVAPEAVCLCREQVIVYLNDAAAGVFGLPSRDEGMGRLFADFVHPDYREVVSELFTDLDGTTGPLPVKLQGAEGTPLDAELIAVPADGDVVIQAVDVTERRRAADAVKRSEMRYRHLVEHSLDMICVVEEGLVTFVNAAGAALLGESEPEQLNGRELTSMVHPDYREIVEEGLFSLSSEGTAFPLKFVRMDGEIVDVEIAVMPFGAETEDSFMLEARDISDRVRSAITLRDREQRLQGIMNTVADGIVTIDERGVIQSINPAAHKIFGYEAGELIGQNVSRLVPEPHGSNHDDYLRNYLRTGEAKIIGVTGREEQGMRKDGSLFPVELAVTELRHGTERLFTGVVRDITGRKKAEDALRRAHDELELRVQERTHELSQEIAERRAAEEGLRLAAEVIGNLSEAVVIVDSEFRVTSVNPAFTDITGFDADEVVGGAPSFLAVVKADPVLESHMHKDLKRDGYWTTEIWNERKNGEKYAERLSISALADELGEVQKYAVVVADVTKRKEDEERIRYQANYDQLTGLPNRALFHDRLNQALATMSRADRKLGLMFIDLDGFKLVNDTLGHDIGDLLLKDAADRLANCIRSGDTVARLGGDEFTVIMPNLTDPKHAPLLGQRILDTLAQPFNLNGHEAFVSGSIGITIYPDDAPDANTLIKNADAAMYRAKEQGKASYHFFTSDLNEEVQERMVLKNGLSKALDRGELSLHYQPKLTLATGQIRHCEALMRWNSSELGMVSPARFIPIMEESGLVVEVGEWAIRVACEQYMKWMEEGLPPVRIAVNLSARQLREPALPTVIERILKETGVPSEGLELEITESMLMTDAQKSVAALNRLHDLGLHVAMDDFGTGYSSLSYLKRFPIDSIKIDRSFVADIATNQDDAEIIRTIITMGQTLNRKIIAEGVETEEQLEMLRGYNCDEIQGYFISRPLPADAFTDFIRDWEKKASDAA